MILGNVLFNTRLTGAISIARPFSSTAVLLLFAGGGPRHAASSRLALNENGRTLNTVFPSIMGIVAVASLFHLL